MYNLIIMASNETTCNVCHIRSIKRCLNASMRRHWNRERAHTAWANPNHSWGWLEKNWCCWQSFHSSGLFFQSCCEKIFNFTYARPLIFTNERRIFAGDCWDQVPIGPTSTQLFWELSGRTGMHWRVQSWRVSQKRALNWYSSSTCKCGHHGLHYSPCLGISKRLSILKAKNQVIFIP